ncbi:MAG: hypothetical protein JWO36_4661 [Myxococcales bacterium]|nr:hypothetical protein [Myxococcales bacterium]
MQRLTCSITIAVSLAAGARASSADSFEPGFIEVSGNWGLQFGTLPYLPDAVPGKTKQPLANGWGAGATAGLALVPDLAVFVDYRYGTAGTRHGELTGALTDVQGTIRFHAFTAGLRIARELGPGRFFAQLGVGAVLPFHTTITLVYAPELAAIAITGTGVQRDEYNVGYGAQGALGYHEDLGPSVYLGVDLRLETFESSNNGRDTVFSNFVTDFTVQRPAPISTTLHHSTTDAVPPTNYSIQDVRIEVSLGYGF